MGKRGRPAPPSGTAAASTGIAALIAKGAQQFASAAASPGTSCTAATAALRLSPLLSLAAEESCEGERSETAGLGYGASRQKTTYWDITGRIHTRTRLKRPGNPYR